jgi:hypothetical protein
MAEGKVNGFGGYIQIGLLIIAVIGGVVGAFTFYGSWVAENTKLVDRVSALEREVNQLENTVNRQSDLLQTIDQRIQKLQIDMTGKAERK